MTWTAPSFVSRDELVAADATVAALPDRPVKRTEDVLRVHELGLDWDIGIVRFEPSDVTVGPDGRKVGVFVLHGGASDFKSLDPLVRILAHKFGFTVFAGTYPGRFHFDDPDHDWADDTIKPDGTVRTPIWLRGETIGPDQYDVVTTTANRDRWGVRAFARARPGSVFHHRMAAWPAAFETGFVAANRLCFPPDEYSVYATGHSTGGPFVCMLAQRIPHLVGLLAMENSTFGYTKRWPEDGPAALGGPDHEDADPMAYRFAPFHDLYLRTWRDIARYAGPEVLGDEGPAGLLRLPAVMEDVLSYWDSVKNRPQFKAESLIPVADLESLTEAATVTADRLGYDPAEREALVARYLGYTRELTGPSVKPMPNALFSIARNSRDHTRALYEDSVLPAFRAMRPAPTVSLTEFGAGGHSYWRPMPDLPAGLAPAVALLWNDAIAHGFFLR